MRNVLLIRHFYLEHCVGEFYAQTYLDLIYWCLPRNKHQYANQGLELTFMAFVSPDTLFHLGFKNDCTTNLVLQA